MSFTSFLLGVQLGGELPEISTHCSGSQGQHLSVLRVSCYLNVPSMLLTAQQRANSHADDMQTCTA